MKSYREFLSLLESQQSELAKKIFQKNGEPYLYSSYLSVDPTSSKKYMPVIAYFKYNMGRKYYTEDEMKSIFNEYHNLVEMGKLQSVYYSKTGVYYPEPNSEPILIKSMDRFYRMVKVALYEYESEYVEKDEDEIQEDPIWSNDRYKIYLTDSKEKCIDVGRDTPFCISEEGKNNMYHTYDNYTMYFVFDSNPDKEKEGVMNIGIGGNSYTGIDYMITDLENKTKRGYDGKDYFEDYLKRHPGIPRSVFKTEEDIEDGGYLTDKEVDIKKMLHMDKFDDVKDKIFKNFIKVEQKVYIKLGGKLSAEKWKMISSGKVKNFYVNKNQGEVPADLIVEMSDKYKKRVFHFQDIKVKESIEKGDLDFGDYTPMYIVQPDLSVYFGRFNDFIMSDEGHVCMMKSTPENRVYRNQIGIYNLKEYKEITPMIYQNIKPEYDSTPYDAWVFEQDDKQGLINYKNGQIILNPKYDVVESPNKDGLVKVSELTGNSWHDKGQYFGVYDIDKDEEIIEPIYDKVFVYENMIMVVKDNKKGNYNFETKEIEGV